MTREACGRRSGACSRCRSGSPWASRPSPFRSSCARAALPMTRIATVSQVASCPTSSSRLWSPVARRGAAAADVVLRIDRRHRRSALAATALIPPEPRRSRLGPVPLLWVYTAALFVAQAAVATSGSAVLAMMALTVPDAQARRRVGMADGRQPRRHGRRRRAHHLDDHQPLAVDDGDRPRCDLRAVGDPGGVRRRRAAAAPERVASRRAICSRQVVAHAPFARRLDGDDHLPVARRRRRAHEPVQRPGEGLRAQRRGGRAPGRRRGAACSAGVVNIAGALLGGRARRPHEPPPRVRALRRALRPSCAIAMLLAPASPGRVHRRLASRTSSPTASATRCSTRSSSSSSARARARRR